MNATEELEEWYAAERVAGRVVDLKFFPGVDSDGSIDRTARAVLETVRGERVCEPLDTSDL